MSTNLVIIGAGGHAVSVANVAYSCGLNLVAFIDDAKVGKKVLGIPVISKQYSVENYQSANFSVAIGDNAVRERVFYEYKSAFPDAQFPPLIHQSAVIGINSQIDDGTVIMPLANVGPNSKVGAGCILNTSSSIDHDCEMHEFSSIAPRVVLGGNVIIGSRSAISIGATIKHNILIGSDVVVGASSYVNKPIENNVLAYGSPCKFISKRKVGESYLS